MTSIERLLQPIAALARALWRIGLLFVLLILVVLWAYAALLLIVAVAAGRDNLLGRALAWPFETINAALNSVGDRFRNSFPGGPKGLAKMDDEGICALRVLADEAFKDAIRTTKPGPYIDSQLFHFQQYDSICKSRGIICDMSLGRARELGRLRPDLKSILEF